MLICACAQSKGHLGDIHLLWYTGECERRPDVRKPTKLGSKTIKGVLEYKIAVCHTPGKVDHLFYTEEELKANKVRLALARSFC